MTTATAVEVKETGMIFTGESIRAILNGKKTQTRRIIKPQPLDVPLGQPHQSRNNRNKS
jgi:hypothetical protein